MSTIAFDTHEFIKELKSAGFSEELAETKSELIRWIVSVGLLQTALLIKLSSIV